MNKFKIESTDLISPRRATNVSLVSVPLLLYTCEVYARKEELT